MGKIINRKVSIDEETGEIIDEKGWIGYDGFTNKGYQYRRRESCIRYFFDSLPDNLSEASWILLLSSVPGIVLVGMISVAKEFADRTGFSVLDIVAALIGCATVEVALLIGIVAGILSV